MIDAPWLVLAGGSVILAVAFGAGLGVPGDRPPGIRGVIARWGHSAVWILLAGLFIALDARVEALVAPMGALAGAAYVVYLFALLTSSPGRRRRPGSGP